MIYPQNFEEKSGFTQIRSLLYDYCLSSLGKRYAEKMRFSPSVNTIETLLSQTEELRQILLMGENFPQSNYFDLINVLDRLKTEGTYAEPEELGDLRVSLITISEITTFLKKSNTDTTPKYPYLTHLGKDIYLDKAILRELNRILDDSAKIRDNASAKLLEIRTGISRLTLQVNRRIIAIMNQARQDGLVDNDTELAFRNNRQVIPVPAAYKRKIRGFVHDQSSTGQTVYIEPEEIFELNNDIRQLELDERKEVIAILKQFADFLREFLPDLREAYFFLGKIDFIRAKARLALEMDAMKPRLNNYPVINWIGAKHPLLWLSYKSQKKHVEPLNLQLEKKAHIIVISGPNAGGKSVCLKTVALVQYMLQCGLLVPMTDYSDTGVFSRIFIDIGDEQSIENDLSTYSSHLQNMRYFIEKMDGSGLFLIDEFGAGTEPRLGGAIAEAILEELLQKGAFGVITTHYSNLKILANKSDGIINGSMLFDTQNMRPLYRLKTGTPGSSFAFEIAKTMGIPSSILIKAEQIAGTEHIDFERQLQDLELKKIELENKEKQLKSGDAFLSELIERYEKLNNELTSQKLSIINEAKRDAKKILAESNKMIEKTIKEIKENAADKEKTRLLRSQLDEYTSQINPSDDVAQYESRSQKRKKEKSEPKAQEIEISDSPIEPGDQVRIKGQENIGEVESISGKDAVIAFGSIIMKSPLKKLEKIKRDPAKGRERKITVKTDFNINEKAAEFNPSLDIRGNRADDGLQKSRRFVDDAILLGAKQIKIVHGTGDGILREALRDYLKTLPEVGKVRDEHPDRGGAGCTLIQLK